ncbi:prepilin-type N-terminal cleavage/methylation domain-containing protein [Actinoplanes siamensis]|uniref:Prepilin-type N-terminal cleavage/methylation domain-containing protein n=1 Tax=Actinoplanes siamensis TaxID=1223317 RepID=A0A919NB88_9ACTN|nr:prepilin-type N-terminal cleavage/methylation domain-containing protein [Actinoplanes siamensis]GIF07589.1 hypothetical protein Asi03nite_51270 [Actinoplanes siamensis]
MSHRDELDDSSDDRGFTLIELLVGMGLMSVVMVVTLGALMQIYSTVNRSDGLVTTRDQIGNSFRRLDKELRYATWVSPVGQVDDAWYLEYATGTDCRQLAFKDGMLTRAVWTTPGSPGTPTTIATDLVRTGTVPPFTIYLPGATPYATASPNTSGVGKSYVVERTQIRLRFTGRVGTTSLPLDVLFTAQNTNRNTVFADSAKGILVDNECSKGRPS